jgi:hypothetical protein
MQMMMTSKEETMKLFENFKEGIRTKMKSFLRLDEAQLLQINITQGFDEETKIAKNTIWYRGDPYELSQLYKQLPNKQDTFWGSVPTRGMEIRKIHTGMPALIVDTLTDIVISDYNGIEFKEVNVDNQSTWEDIEKENKMNELLKEAIKEALYKGEGAFKISFDEEISTLPIIEFFPKDMIEVIRKRGRVREIIFKSFIKEKDKTYMLKEIYGYGYIIYKLFDIKGEKEYPLNILEQTKGLDNVLFDDATIDNNGKVTKYGTFMLASLFKIEKDAIFDKKTDDFDSLDEAWSQWMNALRDGRSKTYIPECLIPKDPETGDLIKPNSFDNKFIKIESDLSEDGKNKIDVEQPTIPTDSYMNTYVTALDLALQGIISPSTLGIDTKKITDPNATAQREKEKTTLYTRGKIVEAVSNTIPDLVNITFKAIATQNKASIEEIEVNVDFGEYANPSFEAQVETVSKGRQGGIMSVEASVDELYGDSKDEEWKAEEVARLKAEQGIIDVEEPAVNEDLDNIDITTNENNNQEQIINE